MATNARRPRLVLLAAIVTALAVINAMALWGDAVAHRGEAILQLSTGLGAVACGIVMARRMSGTARWWRLFFAAAAVCWLLGQVLWWTSTGGVVRVACEHRLPDGYRVGCSRGDLAGKCERQSDRKGRQPVAGPLRRQRPRRGRRRRCVPDPGGHEWLPHWLDCCGSPVGCRGRRDLFRARRGGHHRDGGAGRDDLRPEPPISGDLSAHCRRSRDNGRGRQDDRLLPISGYRERRIVGWDRADRRPLDDRVRNARVVGQ